MDLFDRASVIEARQTEMAIAQHFAAKPNAQPAKSACECIECGDPIPEARQKFIPGCLYCTPCQSLFEQGKL